MLTEPLDIINAACARIGEEPLQTFSDDSGQAAHLTYRDVVDFNLSLTRFSFAHEWVECSKRADIPVFSGYKSVFEVPGEWLAPPIRLSDDISEPDRVLTRYQLQRTHIHADCDTLFALRAFNPEPYLWAADFRSATIAAISARLALALASDEKLYQLLNTEAYGTPQENHRGGLIGVALRNDAQRTQQRRIPLYNNPFEKSWRGT